MNEALEQLHTETLARLPALWPEPDYRWELEPLRLPGDAGPDFVTAASTIIAPRIPLKLAVHIEYGADMADHIALELVQQLVVILTDRDEVPWPDEDVDEISRRLFAWLQQWGQDKGKGTN